jgi:hypothetical protein
VAPESLEYACLGVRAIRQVAPLWESTVCRIDCSGFSRVMVNSRNYLILLVGTRRFERPTPSAQGRCALGDRPTLSSRKRWLVRPDGQSRTGAESATLNVTPSQEVTPRVAEDPRRIMAKSDDDLQFWALSGDVGTYVHEIGQTAMNMRCSLRMAEASKEMVAANRDLVDATRTMLVGNEGLVRQTKNLVRATWGVVVITLLTQLALICLVVAKGQ